MNNPSRAAIEARKARYSPGSRVELISMSDLYTTIDPGERGTVKFVDDTGTVFVAWDCGSNLGVVYGVDQIKLLPVLNEAVKVAILAVRATGVTNMFDTNAVQRIANDMGLYDLVCFIESNRKGYSHFILTGERDGSCDE